MPIQEHPIERVRRAGAPVSVNYGSGLAWGEPGGRKGSAQERICPVGRDREGGRLYVDRSESASADVKSYLTGAWPVGDLGRARATAQSRLDVRGGGAMAIDAEQALAGDASGVRLRRSRCAP